MLFARDRRRRHGALAVRAADPAGAALGGRHRRAAAAAGDRARPRGHVHDHDRRDRRAGRRRRPLRHGALRTVAVLVLLGFGALLLAPRLADRVEAWLSPLIRYGPRTRGDGFVSGLGVGAALGFVYAPCAGPILAAVISVSAASGATVAVALSYAAGSAAALLALCLGGRRVLRPRPRPGAPARDGRGHGAHRARHPRRRRPALPDRDRRRPARRARQPDRRARALGRGRGRARRPARPRRASRRPRAGCRSSARRRSSPASRAGSTRRRSRSPACAGRSC